jgi:hypothetical protein
MSRVDQVGGDHYLAEFQHWDWAAETQLGYLEGNATKYVARWRKKNGRQDLEKARSYVRKLMGVHNQTMLVPAGYRPGQSYEKATRFVQSAGLNEEDADIIHRLDCWTQVQDLINVVEALDRIITKGTEHPAPFGYDGEG